MLTFDHAIGLLGVALSILGLGVSAYAIHDNRRLRTAREKAVAAAFEMYGRSYGTLIGIKPAVNDRPDVTVAINDGLTDLREQRGKLAGL